MARRTLNNLTDRKIKSLVRAGDQIDLDVNPDQLPEPIIGIGPARPVFAFQQTDFWAQGLNLGLDYRW